MSTSIIPLPISDHVFEGESQKAVDARQLHEFLESKQRFSDWIKNRIRDYSFEENVDYFTNHKIMTRKNARGSSKQIDYTITLDMAKELAMVERNHKGKQARKYFIEVEKAHRKALQLQQYMIYYSPEELSYAAYNQEHTIRVITLNGRHWFLAKDICRVLRLHWNATRKAQIPSMWKSDGVLRDFDKQRKLFETLSEQGVYHLAAQSALLGKDLHRWMQSYAIPKLNRIYSANADELVSPNIYPSVDNQKIGTKKEPELPFFDAKVEQRIVSKVFDCLNNFYDVVGLNAPQHCLHELFHAWFKEEMEAELKDLEYVMDNTCYFSELSQFLSAMYEVWRDWKNIKEVA